MAYPLHLVTFVDILGFKDIVSRGDATEVGGILDKFALHAAATASPDIITLAGGNPADRRVYRFSDTVVRTFQFRDETPNAVALHAIMEVLDLAIVQWELARKGVLIRGALTAGGLITGPDIAYGPGLVKAYELESKVAIFPRLVIDEALFAPVLDTQPGTEKRKIDAIKDGLSWGAAIDFDGVWMVDYLEFAFKSMAEKHRRKLLAHREAIVRAIETTRPGSRERSKAAWLAGYHDRHVEALVTRGDLTAELADGLNVKSAITPPWES